MVQNGIDMENFNSIPQFDLNVVQNIEKVDSIDNDFFLFETIGHTDFQHFADLPIRPNALIICLSLEGTCNMTINLKTWSIPGNNITVIAPDNVIQYQSMSDDYHSFIIGMSRSFYESIFSRQNDVFPLLLYFNENPNFKLTADETNVLVRYFHLMKEKTLDIENAYRRYIIQGILTAFLYEFYNIYKKRIPLDIKPKTRKEEIFAHFIKAVADNYHTQRTVSAYAEMLYLTPKHLSGVIKEVSGKTPGEWIDERVILEAKALLKSSEMNIQQIAESLNFTNQSFFGKYFRHHVGMSPKEYRQN